MNKRKKRSFEELVKKNKLELLRDQAHLKKSKKN